MLPLRRTRIFIGLYRGGGPGTFALVLSATIKAHADFKVSTASLDFKHGDGVSQDALWDAVAIFVTTLPSLVDSDVYVVYALIENMFDFLPIIAPGVPLEQLKQLLGPVFAKLGQRGIPYRTYTPSAIPCPKC